MSRRHLQMETLHGNIWIYGFPQKPGRSVNAEFRFPWEWQRALLGGHGLPPPPRPLTVDTTRPLPGAPALEESSLAPLVLMSTSRPLVNPAGSSCRIQPPRHPTSAPTRPYSFSLACVSAPRPWTRAVGPPWPPCFCPRPPWSAFYPAVKPESEHLPLLGTALLCSSSHSGSEPRPSRACGPL